jgi:hypothetical protein
VEQQCQGSESLHFKYALADVQVECQTIQDWQESCVQMNHSVKKQILVFSNPKSIGASKETLQPRFFLFMERMWRWHGVRCLVGYSRTFKSQEIPKESCKSEMCRNGADALWDTECAEPTGIMLY